MNRNNFDFHNTNRWCYVTNHYNNIEMSKALIAGFEAQPIQSQRVYNKERHVLEDTFAVYRGLGIGYGILRGVGDVMNAYEEADLPFLYCDHSMFGQRRTKMAQNLEGYYRCIKNGRYSHQVPDCPPDRFSRLHLEVAPWRPTGSHIVVCPLSTYVANYIGVNADEWLMDTMAMLAFYTDRDLIVKPKDDQTPLEDVLKDAWALVTYESNAAVDAALLGVPVFCQKTAAAAPIGNFELQHIERPDMPDRQQWLNNLAYMQFTKHEIINGTAADILYGDHK